MREPSCATCPSLRWPMHSIAAGRWSANSGIRWHRSRCRENLLRPSGRYELSGAVAYGARPSSAGATVENVQAAFEDVYRARYGHLNEGTGLAFVVLRVGGLVPTQRPKLDAVGTTSASEKAEPHSHRSVYFAGAGARLKTAIYRRNDLPEGFSIKGPAIIEEYSSTTVVSPQDTLTVGRLGELRISCAPALRKGAASHG